MGSANRIYLLDILRGFAAFSIVIFHYRIFYGSPISSNKIIHNEQPFFSVLSYAYEYGWMAVQFFFILSGYIFYLFYYQKINSKNINFNKFFILRFSRLYPLHLLCLLTISFLIYSNFENYSVQNFNFYHFFLNIFLVQNWGVESGPSFNEPAWSISVEMMMYIIFYFVSTRKSIYLNTFFLIILSLLLFSHFKLIAYALFCFNLGGLTFLFHEKIKNKFLFNKSKRFYFILLILSMLIFLSLILKIVILNSIQIKIIFLIFIFPLILVLSDLIQDHFIIKKISFLGIIGNFSYSIYMIHYVFQIFIIKISIFNDYEIDFNSKYFFILYLVSLIILSILSYYLFERPAQKIIRKKFI